MKDRYEINAKKTNIPFSKMEKEMFMSVMLQASTASLFRDYYLSNRVYLAKRPRQMARRKRARWMLRIAHKILKTREINDVKRTNSN